MAWLESVSGVGNGTIESGQLLASAYNNATYTSDFKGEILCVVGGLGATSRSCKLNNATQTPFVEMPQTGSSKGYVYSSVYSFSVDEGDVVTVSSNGGDSTNMIIKLN